MSLLSVFMFKSIPKNFKVSSVNCFFLILEKLIVAGVSSMLFPRRLLKKDNWICLII